MRIAVNTRFLLKDQLEGVGYFLFETLSRITRAHPEHEFIFIFDRPYDARFIFSSNITPVVVGPPARHPLLWKYWFDIKIPAVLKKYKADIFVSADGFCSLNTKIPQCIVVHDLAFLHYPDHYKKSHYIFYKRYTPKFLLKAKTIATVSQFSKKDMTGHFRISENKIDVVYSAAKDIFQPASENLKQLTKANYTGGKEYFLYVGSIHPRKNLMNLLKAFSVFKKRQKSEFRLVIVGRLAWKYNSFVESLKTYKYRNDVVVPGYASEEDVVAITGSAWALVYPSLLEGFGVPPLEAMKSDVPVITSVNSSMQEIGGEAALYADPKSVADIADKMMLIYKDESLKKELIEKGRQVVKRYSWDRTTGLLWQTIVKTFP